MSAPRPLGTGPFGRLARASATRRRPVMLVWLVLLVVLGAFAPKLTDQLKPGGFQIAGSSSDHARQLLETRFASRYPQTLVVTVSAVAPSATPGVLASAAADVSAVLRRNAIVRDVTEVTPPGGRDATDIFLNLGLGVGLDDALREVGPLESAAKRAVPPGVSVGFTGGGALFHDFNTVNETDLRLSETAQLPVVALILVLVLGSLIAAGLPLLTTLVALVSTLGGLYFVALALDLSIYVSNVVPLVGIGVAVDYSLFLVNRFREELDRGREPLDAIAVTGATAGRAIFFSGLTVAVALAGMLAVGIPIFTGFAVGTISVVILAVVVALTLLPALLVALAGRLRSLDVGGAILRAIHVKQRVPEADLPRSRWARWAELVMRRPWPFLLGSAAVLLALAIPALSLRMAASNASALPTSAQSIRTSRIVAAHFGIGAVSPSQVLVDRHGPAMAGDPALPALASRLAQDPEVASVLPGFAYSSDGSIGLVTVLARHADDTPEAQDLVSRIEHTIVPSVPSLAGAQVSVGGGSSQNLDFTRTVRHNLPRVIGLVMILTFLVLVVLFRSIILPLKAVVMTLLSALASYGVLVMVFQWGWGDSLLGFEHLGHVTSWVPPFLFSILFGLSMDYEVFLLSRIREHRDAHGDDREAVAWGLARTGRIITAAAAIMVVVFLSFLLNRLIPIKEASLGLAVAVFLDATLVRIMLVPAFMRLAGKWNWWLPGPLDRILPRFDEGDVPHP